MQPVNKIWPVYVILQKRKNYNSFFAKPATRKLVPQPFVFSKNYPQLLLENDVSEVSYLY